MRYFTIRVRIIMLIAVSMLFSFFVGAAFLYQIHKLDAYAVDQTQSAMLVGQKEKLKVTVHSMALALSESYKRSRPDPKTWAETITAQIDPIRFEPDGSGYFFVYDGTVVVWVPIRPELAGRDLIDVKDSNGVAYVFQLSEAARRGGDYVSYIFDKPGTGLTPKLAYAEMIPGTNNWIGTGVYIDNIEAKKSEIQTTISTMVKKASLGIGAMVAVLFALCVLPLSIVIFRSIVKPLSAATKAADEVAGGNLHVRLEAHGHDEVALLERALNTMVVTLQDNLDRITKHHEEVMQLNREIMETQLDLLSTLGEVIESRSHSTANHVRRVAAYSELLGREYGLSETDVALLKFASPMHDVGKIGIPDDILNSTSSLTQQEIGVIKHHTVVGYHILHKSEGELVSNARLIALQHHERWDGTGYPCGLKGEDINILARITTIADVYDSLSSERVYKKAWSQEKVLEFIRQQSGAMFDPALVELFLKHHDKLLAIKDSLSDPDAIPEHDVFGPCTCPVKK